MGINFLELLKPYFVAARHVSFQGGAFSSPERKSAIQEHIAKQYWTGRLKKHISILIFWANDVSATDGKKETAQVIWSNCDL